MSISANTALRLTEEQAMLMDVAREFCRDKSPVSTVREHLEAGNGYPDDVWQEIKGLGWPGIALSEACGGSGLDVGAMVPVFEAMGRSLLTTPLMSTVLAGQLLYRVAGESAESHLASIAAGSVATVGWLESGDWGASAIGTTLSDSYALSGCKRLVQDASVADFFLVPALRSGQVVIAIVPAADLADAALTPNSLVDLTRRSADVDFTGVEVKPGNIIEGVGVSQALHDVKLIGALLVAAEAAGSSAACLDTIVDYLKTRKQFGKLIGSYQALKHPAVEILCQVDSTRSLVYHAASLVEQGSIDGDTEIACRMAKAQSVETICYAGDRAVQFHGGMGFTWDCDAQLHIRRAQWSQQQFGDAQHHRRRLAALLLD